MSQCKRAKCDFLQFFSRNFLQQRHQGVPKQAGSHRKTAQYLDGYIVYDLILNVAWRGLACLSLRGESLKDEFIQTHSCGKFCCFKSKVAFVTQLARAIDSR